MNQLEHAGVDAEKQPSWWPESLSPDVLAANDLPTPYLLCDLDSVRERYFELARHMPFADTYYAVKCNSSPEILRCLADLGAGFEVASVHEIELLRSLGVPGSAMLFGNPIKPPADVKAAHDAGVRRFVIDSAGELQKLARYAPTASVICRIEVDNSDSVFPLSGKFGADPDEAGQLLLKARSLGLQPYGISFHVGSQCLAPAAWGRAIGVAAGVLRKLERQGIRLGMLDLGGGFPARYTSRVPTMAAIGITVSAALREMLPYRPIEIVAEPGRYLVAESAVLATSVIGKAKRRGVNWLYTDVGVYNGLMEAAQGAGHWRFPMATSRTQDASVAHVPFTIAGPSCDTSDTIVRDVELPETIDVGDRLYIGSAGAYTLSYASSFNGFAPPITAFVQRSGQRGELSLETSLVGI